MPEVRTQSDDPARPLWRVHGLFGVSRLQVREAEFYRRKVPRLQRRRTRRKEGAQRQHVLRLFELSEVQIHFGQQADRGEVSKLRTRVPGREESEIGSGDRVPEQRVRLRA